MSFDFLMVNRCTILRRAAGGEDDSGHNLGTYQAIHTDVPCRLYESTGTEMKVGEELTIAESKVALRPIGVIELDALEINGRGYNVKHVYEVRALTDAAHHLQLSVEELKTWPPNSYS